MTTISATTVRIAVDMETSDPDDFLALALLLGHPRADVTAVTLTPGTADQVGLVRLALGWSGHQIPVGASRTRSGKRRVSAWHRRAFGEFGESTDAAPPEDVLLACCDPATTLLTLGPLTNVRKAIRAAEQRGVRLRARRLVAQGGFAGVGVVPQDQTLPKFAEQTAMPSFNFNADVPAAKMALHHPGFAERRVVSKNVCHGVVYDQALHARLGKVATEAGTLRRVHDAMATYLRRKPGGKKFHDPFAAMCALDLDVADWREVEVVHHPGEWSGMWSSHLAPGSGTWITVAAHHERFAQTLLAVGPRSAPRSSRALDRLELGTPTTSHPED